MSAGTLTLTNNSAAVTGSGTALATELSAGDFIVVTVGGIPYTLPVKTVNSATSLTLVSNYTGPTQSGAAWYAVPRVAMNLVTAALVAQNTEALRGLNYDKQNWQQFFTAEGDFTITLPDNSQTSGPSAKKLINSVDGKAAKGANSDITSLSGLTTALSVSQGGTGAKNPADARVALELTSAATTSIGTSGGTIPLNNGNNTWGAPQFFSGGAVFVLDSTQLNDIVFPGNVYTTTGPNGTRTRGMGMYAGADSASFTTPCNINLYSWNGIGFCTSFTTPSNGVLAGAPAVYINTRTGTINAKGAVQANGVTLTSDWNAKEAVTIIDPDDALQKMGALDGYTFRYKEAESDRLTAGVLAQDLDMIIPDLVIRDEANDFLVADYMGVIGYLVAAVKGLKLKVDDLTDEITSLKNSGS